MIGSVLGGFGSLVGGISNAILGGQSNKAQKEINSQNLAMQKEFAQNSIQWRVADAKKAGIHPLYALGANGASYTPQSFDSSGYQQVGQGISDAMNGLVLSGQKLSNELLASQVEAQKISNASQKSDLLSKINTGLAQNYFANRLVEGSGYDTLKGLQGEDLKQVFQDYASEHPLLMKGSTYFDLPENVKNTKKVDFLGSMGPTLKLRDLNEDTYYDIGKKNIKDWLSDIYNTLKRDYNIMKSEHKMDWKARKRYEETKRKYDLY